MRTVPTPTQYAPFEPAFDHASVCEKLAAQLAAAGLELARLQVALDGATAKVHELQAVVAAHEAGQANAKAPGPMDAAA